MERQREGDRRAPRPKRSGEEKRRLLRHFVEDTTLPKAEMDGVVANAPGPPATAGRDNPITLLEIKGSPRLPPSPGAYDHTRGRLAHAWQEALQIYLGMSEALMARTIPPDIAMAAFTQWRPVYYLDRRGAITVAKFDRQHRKLHGLRSRAPHRLAPQLRLSLNLGFSIQDILVAVETILRKVPKAARSRQRYSSDDVARIIVWYYRRQAGTPLKELAANEASREHRGRRAAATGSLKAVDQAAKRIRAGIRWFKQHVGTPA